MTCWIDKSLSDIVRSPFVARLQFSAAPPYAFELSGVDRDSVSGRRLRKSGIKKAASEDGQKAMVEAF